MLSGTFQSLVVRDGLADHRVRPRLSKLMHLKVVDEQYDRIGFGQATFRHVLKYVSHFVLEIGFLMIAFRESKEGLHDLMAGTYVIHAP